MYVGAGGEGRSLRRPGGPSRPAALLDCSVSSFLSLLEHVCETRRQELGFLVLLSMKKWWPPSLIEGECGRAH